MKKIVIFLVILLSSYYLIGFILFSVGSIEKLPVFFNTVIKKKSNDDFSIAAADGPYIFYKNNVPTVCNITQCDTALKINQRVFSSLTPIDCYIPETKETFSFRLKERLVIQPDNYQRPEKMLVLSDIEGNFAAFSSLLVSAGVADSAFCWKFGTGHLVLLGDFVDRGLNVTQVLWLIYKLEEEAEESGGKIHFILGNHEVMNLTGNTKYVRRKYKENFKLLGRTYQDLFSGSSEIGRWLRTKNIIERIGEFVFVHGGISNELVDSGALISEINQTFRTNLDKLAKERSSRAELIFDTEDGPFWYRGLAKEELSNKEVTKILQYMKTDYIVIGHTLVDSINSIYDNRIVLIDLPHEENWRNGKAFALLINGPEVSSVDLSGKSKRLFRMGSL